MKKFCILSFNNYYAIVVILGLTKMLGVRDLTPLVILLTIYIAFVSFDKHIKTFDGLVILWIVYSLMSSLWTNDLELAYYGVKSEIVPILFYFIARGKYCGHNQFLDNMRYPLLFAFVSALYLFVFPPSWYTSFKTQNLSADISQKAYFEATRLSGFWVWSYFIGYASLFFIMYQTKKNVIDNKNLRFFTSSFLVAILCLFLAQQRASIAFFLIYIPALLLYGILSNRKIKKMSFLTLIMIFAVFAIYIVAITFIDKAYIDYIFERTIENENNLVEERINLFSQFNKSFSLLGSGIGSMGHNMLELRGKESITDCDYLRIPNEYGIIGALILFSIIVVALFNGCKRLSKNWFNVSVITFLLVSMIGAAPLEAYMLEPYLYWYCIGQIEKNKI